MSKIKFSRQDIDRAQAEIVLSRGLSDAPTLEVAAVLASTSAGDLCAVLEEQRRLSAEQAAAIRAEAARALGAFHEAGRQTWVVGASAGSSWATSLDGDSVDREAAVKPSDLKASAPGYEILGMLGQGAMGLVARARHRETGREVALKFIQSPAGKGFEAEDLRRFQREAEALILLKHRCLVGVFDVSMSEGAVFLAMEFVDGQNLRAEVEQLLEQDNEPPSWGQVSWVFEDLAEALDYCHGQGIIHRDVKPQNIVIDLEEDRAVLIDFGLIKRVDAPGASQSLSLTYEGATVGTPAFMSPEQLFPGSEYGPVTAASDVFAFGATLFYTLTGQTPYGGGSMIEIAMRMKDGPAPDLRELSPNTPAWVAELCASCLDHVAAERPAMFEIKEAFQRARAPGSSGMARSLALVAALMLILGSALGAALWILSDTPTPPGPIKEEAPADKLLVDDGVQLTIQRSHGPVCFVDPPSADGLIYVDARARCDSRTRFDFIYEGRRYEVRDRSVKLAIAKAGERGAKVPLSLEGGEWKTERRSLWTAEDRAAARRALADHKRWASTDRKFLKELGRYVAFKLRSDFDDLGLRLFECQGLEYAILRLRHKQTKIIFHLIPGGEVTLDCYADPKDSLVRALVAIQRVPEIRRHLRDYLTDNISGRARQYFGHRFDAVLASSKSLEGLTAAEKDLLGTFLHQREGWRETSLEQILPLLDRFYPALGEALIAEYTIVDRRRVAPFLMAAQETTEGEWDRLTASPYPRKTRLPITGVPYRQLRRIVEDGGLGLPLREQWLHALAGGSEAAYFWGDEPELIDRYAWYKGSGRRRDDDDDDGDRRRSRRRDDRRREPPRLHPASDHDTSGNAFGLVDMLGNASEWGVEDWPAALRRLREGGIKTINVDETGRRLVQVTGDDKPVGEQDGARHQPVFGGDVESGTMSARSLRAFFREVRRGESRSEELQFYGCRLVFELDSLGL